MSQTKHSIMGKKDFRITDCLSSSIESKAVDDKAIIICIKNFL